VIPEFSAATNEALLPYMQEGIKPKNPLDVGIPTTLKDAADQLEIVARDPGIDIVAWASPLPGKGGSWNDIHELQRVLSATDKPVIAFGRMIHQVTQDGLDVQERAGFPFLQGQQPLLRALNALWFFGARAGRTPPTLPPVPQSDLTPANLEATLKRYGIAQPQSRAVGDAQQAAEAAAAIGFPVALKIRSADIVHKTEAGGVMLDLRSREQVVDAANALSKAAHAAHPGAKVDGFLVQEMVSGVEAIVGAHTDPLYGPLLLVGSGGIMVELVRDIAQRLLPVETRDVAAMIDELKLARLLAGYRGKPAADRKALEATALGLARFYLDHRARIAEVELNPLMVRQDGAVAVDVRVVWQAEPSAR
jgi:acetate---CoA ligase (ADP-forming)